jgi:hypothetical protein
MVQVDGRKVNVMSLPSEQVNHCGDAEECNTSGGSPDNDRVAQEVVFDCCGLARGERGLLLSSQEHIRRPTFRSGHCHACEARSSCLSGSGMRALFDVIIATLRWMKSRRKGLLYVLAVLSGTYVRGVSGYAVRFSFQ